MSILAKQNKGEAYAQRPRKLRDRVLSTLNEHIYCTRRQLSEQTGIEIASLCGVLKTLLAENLVRIPFSVPCETTGKFVVCYTLNTSEVV